MNVFLGIDIGTSGTKTLAIDETGRVLAEALETYVSHHPRPSWSEQAPDDWWAATVATVRSVMQLGGFKPQEVRAIGLSGQMHGAVFLDAKNSVIRPAILWNDQRTTKECDEIEEAAGGRAGLVRMVANPALTGFTAPKILWLRKNEKDNWQRVRKVLLPKDEVRRRMTGEYFTDVSDASGTLLLDVKNRTWSTELLERLDIDRSLLPECVESPECTGHLTHQAAEELGLTTECIVVGGAGDCPAGAIGNGIVNKGMATTIIGTSSVVLVHADDYGMDKDGRLHTFCHAVPGKWMMMGVNLSGGGCLQWFRNQLCLADLLNDPAANIYEVLSEEARAVTPGSEGLIFLPYLSGERTPHNDADARGCFIGLSLAHTRGHMVRSIMEGVCFNMRETMELIHGLQIPVNQIRASGGGSKSPVWRQIQADTFGQAVSTVNCDQGPAYGVALLAAVGAGAYKSVEDACNATIRVTQETPPTGKASQFYARAFPQFQQLYRTLKQDFKELAALADSNDAVAGLVNTRA